MRYDANTYYVTNCYVGHAWYLPLLGHPMIDMGKFLDGDTMAWWDAKFSETRWKAGFMLFGDCLLDVRFAG